MRRSELKARIRELENARTRYVTKAQCAARCLEMAMIERSLIVDWLRKDGQPIIAYLAANAIEAATHHATTHEDAP